MRSVLIGLTLVVTGLYFGVLPLCAGEKSVAKGPEEDGTKPALVKIAGEGFMNSHAFQYLTELSDDVGPRVTGSSNERKAEEWGLAKMKAIGLENVHVEKYTIWKGWTRGTAEAEILSPVRHKLHVDAMGWTGSTPAGGAESEVVTVNMFDIDNEIKNVARLKGKVALVVMSGKPSKSGIMLFAQFGDFLRAAGPAGAVAVIGGQGGGKSSGMNLTHTGILGFNADFSVPVVSMTAEDQGQLERFLERGITPRVRFNVQNTFTNGPVETANVVGEIRGREHPEEIFVVGGHLDSWDLAQGTTDNGSGTATTLGAADAIVRSGQRPRRTIRFVLFTGEEQGLDGSFAYIKQHQAELVNHLGDLILDYGQGQVKGFQLGGRDDLLPVFQAFVDALANLRPVEVDDHVESGTDTLPFSMAGLPGINMRQDTIEYEFTHHSAADALEAQKPDVLTQNATLMALAAFWIADRPERFASPWPAERTAKMLRAKHEYEELKAFNIWPFGDLGAEDKDKN
ncbi:MAG TPA: M20/M25/M40 family metallo-hydrolase [Candidatus Angelobacter sp.]|nr:M20/M25/M40 family metallo-hydrolase [Candidatus Angelobacter sp.]